jgi:hypothetical protein
MLDSQRCVADECYIILIYLLTAIGLSPGGKKYSTYLHTNNTKNDTKQTIHRTTQQFWKSAGHAPSWLVIRWHLPYNRGNSGAQSRQTEH